MQHIDQPIITKKELKKDKAMDGVMIRLPSGVRKLAKELANVKSESGTKVTETDIYRSAIILFLSPTSTDSRDKVKGV
jgi:hypothetical protein